MTGTGRVEEGRIARARFRLADGTPAVGWEPAPPGRRVIAWLVDFILFAVTLGVGWLWWSWHTAKRGSTPG